MVSLPPTTAYMDVHVHVLPRGKRVWRYVAMLFLLSSGLVCSSEEPDTTLRTDEEDAVIINPFNLRLDEMNVCAKTSLELASKHKTETELMDRCDYFYPPVTCRALRSGDISVAELYLRVDKYECCDGFLRDRNSCSKDCPSMTYGPNCSLPCSCSENGDCNPVTGSCACQPGWMGRHCERTCPDGRYGDRCMHTCQCQNGGSCHPVTGECLCPSNFAGDRCQTDCRVSPSESGCSSGDFCAHCQQEGTAVCDHIVGACRCRPGWWKRYCAHTCQNQTHGTFCEGTCQCVNAASCLPRDGSCVCLPGWRGVNCDQKCAPGFHGEGCQEQCACPDGGGCDHVTGSCQSCPKGWMGQLCTRRCEDDHWGENCSQACNCAESLTCDPISGTCFRDMASTTPSNERNSEALSEGQIAAVVGSAVLLLILTLLVAGVVFWRRCYRKPNLPRQDNAPRANGIVQGIQPVASVEINPRQPNGTIRYTDDNRRSAAPAPMPRGPATFRGDVDPDLHKYETLRNDTPNPSTTGGPHSYMEIYDVPTEASQIDNPVYTAAEAEFYEIPNATRERQVQANGEIMMRNVARR